ncbi:Fe-S oxidoreductase [Methylorubrum thiocyanatum]
MTPSSICRHLSAGLAACALLASAAAAQDAAPAAQPASGKPANLCQELVAFVKQPEPANKAAATPPQQATAVSNPSGKTEGGKPADGGEPQKTSGLSGSVSETGNGPAPGKATSNPASDPSGNPAVNPNAKANAEAKNPPPPAAPAPAPKPDPAIVAKIEAAAGANDLAACREAARSMRVAGVVMPPPLLALAALDLKYFQQ